MLLYESLYSTRVKISFKQYNPSKQAKYKILIKSANLAYYSNLYRAHAYCGKPKHEPFAHYVCGTKAVIKKLNYASSTFFYDLQGRNATHNTFHRSIPSVNWLLSHGIISVGALQSNKRRIPTELKNAAERELYSHLCFWEKEKKKQTLHSYLVKVKSIGLRKVLFMPTLPTILGTMRDGTKRKPAFHKLHDFIKGGTDVMDRRIRTYACG